MNWDGRVIIVILIYILLLDAGDGKNKFWLEINTEIDYLPGWLTINCLGWTIIIQKFCICYDILYYVPESFFGIWNWNNLIVITPVVYVMDLQILRIKYAVEYTNRVQDFFMCFSNVKYLDFPQCIRGS